MKLIRFTLLLSLLLLVACGGSEPATEAPTAEPVADAPEATDVPPTPEPEPTIPPTLPPPVVVEEETDGEAAPVEDAAVETEAAADAEVADDTVQAPVEDAAMIEEPAGKLPLSEPWPADRFGYGIQSHATIGDPSYTMEVVANQLNLEWVKVQMRWADIQPDAETYNWGIWDVVIDEAHNRGVRVMLSVVTAPAWSRAAGDTHGPPDEYGLYYEFVSDVLNRYSGKVQAVEVWNEQNLDREWRTELGVDPVRYIDFLQGSYDTIKSVDPSVIVISGALAPTGAHDPNRMTFMNDLIWTDEAIALGMLDYTDCVGVHHNGYNLPPNIEFDQTDQVGSGEDFFFKGPFNNPHESWSFATTVRLMTEKVQAVKPDMRLCVTEFGWASAEGYEEYPTNFEWVLDNSLEEQAEWIVQAFQQMQASDDVLLAFLFNFDFGNKGGGPTDDNVPYSIIDNFGVPRPAFGAISAMEKAP